VKQPDVPGVDVQRIVVLVEVLVLLVVLVVLVFEVLVLLDVLVLVVLVGRGTMGSGSPQWASEQ
jgi:hypothetical protein